MIYSQTEVIQYIKENDVKFIKLFFTDILGILHSISIQPSMLEKAFKEGISFDASAVSGFMYSTKSDLFLIPDASSLSVLPWRPQQGRVVRMYCSVHYPDGTHFEGDMRNILKETAKKALSLGFDVKVGTECEFYIFKLGEKGVPLPVPYDNGRYCSLAPFDKGENLRREIILNLERMGIETETSHHESGPGQNEIDFKYSSALEAADNFATFETTVRTIAFQSGLFASFAPKPSYLSYGIERGFWDAYGQNIGTEYPGNGLHINISLYKNGKNLFAQDAGEAKSFTAGILNRIKEITAFLNPLRNSYDRLGSFEAPKYISHSKQNRSQLIRIPAASGDSKRLELRSPDPCCNQYAALSLIIESGLEGIEKNMELPPAVDLDLYKATEEELKGLDKLPSSLNEALDLVEKSDFVKSVFPLHVVESFVDIKRKEGSYQIFGEL